MAPKPFISDGCSGGMSWFYKHVLRRRLPWEKACVVHDRKYWLGGTPGMRKTADAALMRAVIRAGYPYCAILIFLAVRVFGSPYLPFPWRWAFGYRYGTGYRRHSEQKGE